MSAALSEVLSALSELAPLALAEPWDNVGLLLDPGQPGGLSSGLLTVELTASVLEEARGLGADFIVAYHPPIFSDLKRLRASAPGESVIVGALRAGITVYSPHTALDAARGGMAEWLASALGAGTMRPISPHPSDPEIGAGRVTELHEPVSLTEATARIKQHLALSHLRLSSACNNGSAGSAQAGDLVRTMAVCPGAGGSLFEKVGPVDLLLTGEMRHHDVAARAASGTHVILTDHTNTERGYLPVFSERLKGLLPTMRFFVSRADRDPLCLV